MSNKLSLVDPRTGGINVNSVGYEQLITTLTAVGRKVSMQKFYEIPFADYLPVVTGNGAYQTNIINWRTFVKGEGFDAGVIANGGNKSRVDTVDAAFDQVSQNIHNWGLGLNYNIFELEQAMKANNLFSLIEAREVARRKVWDLGLQKVAFFGYGADKGLLNQSGVTVDTTTIPARLPAMTAAQLNTFAGLIWEKYRANCNRTAKATHFVIPEPDFNGLVNFPDPTFTLKTRLEILNDAFKTVSMNQQFKILPLAYSDKTQNALGYNVYTMLNYDEASVKMDIPIDYTQTQAGTVDGFTWQNVAFGSFTGVVAQRPAELIYFTNTAS